MLACPQGMVHVGEVSDFNGRGNTRVVLVRPGEPCSLSVRYHARWQYNSSDYCPGCIVQLYYGLGHPRDVPHAFSTGVVEHGIHNHRGTSTSSFDAPRAPGVYYITQTIDLQYRCRTPLHWCRPSERTPPTCTTAVPTTPWAQRAARRMKALIRGSVPNR